MSAVMGSGYCKNLNDAEPADFVGHECNFCYVTSGSQTCCNAGWPRQKWLCNIICTDSGKKQCTFDSLYAKISSSDDGVSSNLDPGKKTKHILPKNCPFIIPMKLFPFLVLISTSLHQWQNGRLLSFTEANASHQSFTSALPCFVFTLAFLSS